MVNNIRLICVLQVWDYVYCERNGAEIGVHDLFADQAGSVLTKDNLKQRKRSVNKKKWWRRINKKTMSSYKDWHIPCQYNGRYCLHKNPRTNRSEDISQFDAKVESRAPIHASR